MALPVQLVEDLSAARPGDLVRVSGEEARHAVAVRRTRPGERVALTDGAGFRAVGLVELAEARHLRVRLESVTTIPEPLPRVVVVQALPKGDRGELAVQLLTEVGVAVIVPWAAARCVTVWRDVRADKALARWRAAAREAAKQARRAWIPEVTPLADTPAVAGLVRGGTGVVLHPDGGAPLGSVQLPGGDRPVVVVVGPEGGLTEEELSTFADAGAHRVRLGEEVLRTSTAGVAAVAGLLARTSRWGAPA